MIGAKMNKKELRKLIREKKRALTEKQLDEVSCKLVKRLFAHEAYKNARSIYVYMSYNQEVRTMEILKRAYADGKRIAIPKVYGKDMKFIWLDNIEETALGYGGIPEPINDGPVADDETALIIMPGIAFDKMGRRCGYGGGFYDRYLEKHPNHITIALCCDFQMVEEIETDEKDVPVDYVLTENIQA